MVQPPIPYETHLFLTRFCPNCPTLDLTARYLGKLAWPWHWASMMIFDPFILTELKWYAVITWLQNILSSIIGRSLSAHKQGYQKSNPYYNYKSKAFPLKSQKFWILHLGLKRVCTKLVICNFKVDILRWTLLALLL